MVGETTEGEKARREKEDQGKIILLWVQGREEEIKRTRREPLAGNKEVKGNGVNRREIKSQYHWDKGKVPFGILRQHGQDLTPFLKKVRTKHKERRKGRGAGPQIWPIEGGRNSEPGKKIRDHMLLIAKPEKEKQKLVDKEERKYFYRASAAPYIGGGGGER